jgi:hypothetical protein
MHLSRGSLTRILNQAQFQREYATGSNRVRDILRKSARVVPRHGEPRTGLV